MVFRNATTLFFIRGEMLAWSEWLDTTTLTVRPRVICDRHCRHAKHTQGCVGRTGTATSSSLWGSSGMTLVTIMLRSNVSKFNDYNWPICPASSSVHTHVSADVRERSMRDTVRCFGLAQLQVSFALDSKCWIRTLSGTEELGSSSRKEQGGTDGQSSATVACT